MSLIYSAEAAIARSCNRKPLITSAISGPRSRKTGARTPYGARCLAPIAAISLPLATPSIISLPTPDCRAARLAGKYRKLYRDEDYHRPGEIPAGHDLPRQFPGAQNVGKESANV
ncbi:hypothetical protein KM043_008344 [Ampulex compressa]|nr:hypothetical protein KM043_008344 [Ampulex compressa]